MTREAQLPASTASHLSQVADATKMVPREVKVDAYKAMIGTLAQTGDKQGIADTLNKWTRFGCCHANGHALTEHERSENGDRASM